MLPLSIGSLLLALAVLIVVIVFLARPFIQAPKRGPELALDVKEPYMAQKESLLQRLRVLDFEHETGMLPDEEYQMQRAGLLVEAAAVMKTLDELDLLSSEDVYTQIESAVAQLRQRPTADALAVNFCSSCGNVLEQDDRFCSHCGRPVHNTPTSEQLSPAQE